jgi:hypothetical protein
MNESQFEQLINGISLLVAENHIGAYLQYLAACNREDKNSGKIERAYADVSYVYALAEQFRGKIINWDLADDFDFEEFLDKTFGKVPHN